MTFRYAVPLVALSLITAAAQCQVQVSNAFDVQLGQPYPVVDGSHKYYFANGEEMVSVKVDGKHWFIQRFSVNGLNQLSFREYEDMPDDAEVEWIGRFGSKLYAMYSVWDRKDEYEQLFYREIDPATGLFIDRGHLALRIEGKLRGSWRPTGWMNFHVTNKFSFIFSGDEKHLVIRYDHKLSRQERKEGEIGLGMAMFNEDMEKQWEQDIKFPEGMDNLWPEAYLLDRQGRVCILSHREGHRQLIRFDQSKASWENFSINPEGVKTGNASLFEDEAGEMHLAGYCKQSESAPIEDALFLCDLSQDGVLSTPRIIAIEAGTIDLVIRKKKPKKKDLENPNYADLRLIGIITDGADGYLFIGEKQYVTYETYTDSKGRSYTVTIYHYDDQLLTRLRPDGSLVWQVSLPKTSSTSTFLYLHEGDKHGIVYMDQPTKEDLADDASKGDVKRSSKNTYLMAYLVSETDGSKKRHVIVDVDLVNEVKLYQLGWGRITRTGNAQLVMEAYKKKNEDILVGVSLK